jgi:hypothetical protein
MLSYTKKEIALPGATAATRAPTPENSALAPSRFHTPRAIEKTLAFEGNDQ